MKTGFELPVTLRSSKMRTVRLLFIAALFVAAGIWMVFFDGAAGYSVDGIPVYWVGWASIVFFGIAGVAFLFQLISCTAYLRLESEGFTYCSAFRTHTVQWDDVQKFGVMHMHHNRYVGWNYAPDYKVRTGMRGFSKALSGYEACLPDTYGLKVGKLAEVLEILRCQYGAVGLQSLDSIHEKIE